MAAAVLLFAAVILLVRMVGGNSEPDGAAAPPPQALEDHAAIHVGFPIQQYSPLMSSVPGLPVQVTAEGSDRITITVAEGSLLTWAPIASAVENKGGTMQIRSGETFYWSPSLPGKEGTVHVQIAAFRDNYLVEEQQVLIRSTDGIMYTASPED